MRSLFAILGMLVGGMFMFSNSVAQDAEAEKIHDELKGLYEELGSDLGFTSEEELRASTLGGSIRVFMSGLDDIERFRPGTDPRQLMADTKEVIYPIYSGGALRSSITMEQRDGSWQLASFGGSEAELAEASRTKHANANAAASQNYVAVHVPSMQQLFVGFSDQGRMFLIPCHKNDLVDLKVDVAIPVDTAVKAMQPHVAKFKNLVRPAAPQNQLAKQGEPVSSGAIVLLKNNYNAGNYHKYLDVAIMQPNSTPLKNEDNARGGLFFCLTAAGNRHTKWKIMKVTGNGGLQYGDKVYLLNPVPNVGYLDLAPVAYTYDEEGRKPFGGTSHAHNPVFASSKKDRSNGASSQWIIKKRHDTVGSGAVSFDDTVWFESASPAHKNYFLDTNTVAAGYDFFPNRLTKELLIFGTQNPTDSGSQLWTIQKP